MDQPEQVKDIEFSTMKGYMMIIIFEQHFWIQFFFNQNILAHKFCWTHSIFGTTNILTLIFLTQIFLNHHFWDPREVSTIKRYRVIHNERVHDDHYF